MRNFGGLQQPMLSELLRRLHEKQMQYGLNNEKDLSAAETADKSSFKVKPDISISMLAKLHGCADYSLIFV